MKWLPRVLWICVAIEIVGAAVVIVGWLGEPIPPRPDLSHYHPVTAEEIHSLEKKAFDDGTSENWLELGKMYLFFGLFPEAEYCCQLSAKQASNSFAAFYWWGVSLNQLGKTSKAIETFRKALALAEKPGRELNARDRCWYAIGRNYLRQEDVANAEKAFRAGAEFPACRHQLIRILVRSQRAAEALPMLNDLVARYPAESSYYQLRSRAREQVGDTSGAADDRVDVERAPGRLRSDSDSVIAELQLEAGKVGLYREFRESVQLMSRDPQQAVERLRALLKSEWRLELAGLVVKAELRIGNVQQAAELLQEMMNRDGTSAQRLGQLAECYRQLNKHDLAFETRKRVANIRNVEAIHADLARDYDKRGQPKLARKHRALGHMTAGIAKYRQNRISTARSELQQAVKLDPQLSNAWYYLAECHRILDTTQQAVEAYRSCLKVDDNHGRARLRLSQLLPGGVALPPSEPQ